MVAAWVMIGTVWAFVALAGVLALWAIFWDRPRGRARCPKCWHSMAGLAERGVTVCPECGKDAKRVRRLMRTRRRWRIAIPALLVAALLPFWLLPAIERREEGWTALVPTTVWILSLRGREDRSWGDDVTWRRLMLRDAAHPLSVWQIRLLGAWVAPVSAAYMDSLVLRPKAWYRGEPIPFEVARPTRLGVAGYNATVRLVDEHETVLWVASAGPDWPAAYQGSTYDLLQHGWLPPVADSDSATVNLVLRVHVEWGWARSDPAKRIVRKKDRPLKFTIPLVERGAPGVIEAISTPREGGD